MLALTYWWQKSFEILLKSILLIHIMIMCNSIFKFLLNIQVFNKKSPIRNIWKWGIKNYATAIESLRNRAQKEGKVKKILS